MVLWTSASSRTFVSKKLRGSLFGSDLALDVLHPLVTHLWEFCLMLNVTLITPGLLNKVITVTESSRKSGRILREIPSLRRALDAVFSSSKSSFPNQQTITLARPYILLKYILAKVFINNTDQEFLQLNLHSNCLHENELISVDSL